MPRWTPPTHGASTSGGARYHLQWYLAETAEVFVHGLCQALMKRGLPRALMTDNGSPMMAGEVQEGLHRLGIVHAPTMAYAPI